MISDIAGDPLSLHQWTSPASRRWLPGQPTGDSIRCPKKEIRAWLWPPLGPQSVLRRQGASCLLNGRAAGRSLIWGPFAGKLGMVDCVRWAQATHLGWSRTTAAILPTDRATLVQERSEAGPACGPVDWQGFPFHPSELAGNRTRRGESHAMPVFGLTPLAFAAILCGLADVWVPPSPRCLPARSGPLHAAIALSAFPNRSISACVL
jgi:hypothetical protein